MMECNSNQSLHSRKVFLSLPGRIIMQKVVEAEPGLLFQDHQLGQGGYLPDPCNHPQTGVFVVIVLVVEIPSEEEECVAGSKIVFQEHK